MFKKLGPYKLASIIDGNNYYWRPFLGEMIPRGEAGHCVGWSVKLNCYPTRSINNVIVYCKSLDEAKITLDKFLISSGYSFLSQEDFDKLNILI